MKNIQITIMKDDVAVHQYLADILPGKGDLIDVPKNGIMKVISRIFIPDNNRVKIVVENILL